MKAPLWLFYLNILNKIDTDLDISKINKSRVYKIK